MEALSVAASAVQLAAYSASIISFIGKLCQNIHKLPRQYHQYEVQLLLLIHITCTIEHNPALQTPDIEVHLKATTQEVAVLQSLLCQPKIATARSSVLRRVWHTIEGFEQQVAARLQRLIQMTHVLQIAIQSENSRQILDVKKGVNGLISLLGMPQVMTEEAQRVMESSFSGFQLVGDPSTMQDNSVVLVERPESTDTSGTLNMEAQNAFPNATESGNQKPRRRRGHRYHKTTMGKNSTVVQGNIHSGTGPEADIDYTYREGHSYGQIKIGPDSSIVQGDVGTPEGKYITLHDYYDNVYDEKSCTVHGDVAMSGREFLEGVMGWKMGGQRIRVDLGSGLNSGEKQE